MSLEKITLTRRLLPPQVSLFPRLTHRADATHGYTEMDADFWGGSGNVEGDTMAQPQSITSSTTAKGAVPTQGVTIGHVHAAVDYSKKTSRRQGKLKVFTTLTSCIHATTEDTIAVVLN